MVRKECKAGLPRHQLFYGPPGLGKTALALIEAHETGLELVYMQAGRMLTPRKVAETFMGLPTTGYDVRGNAGVGSKKYLVLLDECHMLADFDQFHPILSSRELTPDPWGGVSWLPLLTIVAATNYPNLLPEPFKSRFPLTLRFDPYTESDLGRMIARRFPALQAGDRTEIARRSRGSARAALDFAATVERHGLGAFDSLEIDANGLTPLDRAYLAALKGAGRALSLTTISAMIGENSKVVLSEVEPYLLRLGLITITPKGRELLASDVKRSRGRLEGYIG